MTILSLCDELLLNFQEEFLEQFVKKRQPVVLENCTAAWTAQQTWTAESLLMEGGGSSPWRVDYAIDSDHFEDKACVSKPIYMKG